MNCPKLLTTTVSCLLITSLLPSCETAGGTIATGVATGIIGNIVGTQNRAAGNAISGIGAAIVLYGAYQASQEQYRFAEANARYAIRYANRSRYRYVAVRVPKKNRVAGRPKSDLMLVDKNTGKVVGNRVYETKNAAQVKGGTVANIGGHEALVYGGSGGA